MIIKDYKGNEEKVNRQQMFLSQRSDMLRQIKVDELKVNNEKHTQRVNNR